MRYSQIGTVGPTPLVRSGDVATNDLETHFAILRRFRIPGCDDRQNQVSVFKPGESAAHADRRVMPLLKVSGDRLLFLLQCVGYRACGNNSMIAVRPSTRSGSEGPFERGPLVRHSGFAQPQGYRLRL